MKTPTVALLSLLLAVASLHAQSTINSTNKYGYGANIGWVDFRSQLPAGDPNAANGVVIGEYVCSGYAYAANVGWVNFGSGSAANGIYYSNTSATDFGVNQDGTGRLRGFAYGANIGWINFENTGNPTVDLLTGKFSGYVYSANCGWISLAGLDVNGMNPYVVTTNIIRRGLSTAGDGIPDAWKLLNFGSLANPLAAANMDPDGDGKTNLQEYKDGTNPNNPNSALAILPPYPNSGPSPTTLTWTSVPSMGYRYSIEYNPDLIVPWADWGGGLISASGGPNTSTAVTIAGAQKFFRVRAFQTPLLQP